jgi:hypothetical protein
MSKPHVKNWLGILKLMRQGITLTGPVGKEQGRRGEGANLPLCLTWFVLFSLLAPLLSSPDPHPLLHWSGPGSILPHSFQHP